MMRTLLISSAFVAIRGTDPLEMRTISVFDNNPCIVYGSSITDVNACQTRIREDLATNNALFRLSIPADSPGANELRTLWVSLINHYVPSSNVPTCTAAELDRLDAGITPLIRSDLHSASQAVIDVIKCYFVYHPGTVYVQGYANLLEPLVAIFNAPGPQTTDVFYRAYKALNTVIRNNFSQGGSGVPRLWTDRIKEYVRTSEPTANANFDTDLLQSIVKCPVNHPLDSPNDWKLRILQLMFVYGSKGAVGIYIWVAGHLYNRALSYTIAELTIGVNKLMKEQSGVLKLFTSPDPINDIERIRWGVGINRSRQYSSPLWREIYAGTPRKYIKTWSVPSNINVDDVYRGLRMFRDTEMAYDHSRDSGTLYGKEKGLILGDLVRVSVRENRDFWAPEFCHDRSRACTRLAFVLKPENIAQSEFEALIVDIDGRVKDRIWTLAIRVNHADRSNLDHVFAWTWFKLQMVLFFAFEISYDQNMSHAIGLLLTRVANDDVGIPDLNFNEAIAVMSGFAAGVGLSSSESMLTTVANDAHHRKIFDREIRLQSVASLWNRSILSFFTHPNHHFYFENVLSCGFTINMASGIVMIRQAQLLAAVAAHGRTDDASNYPRNLENMYEDPRFNTPPANLLNENTFPPALYRVYMARIFDLYNFMLFRDTLDELPIGEYPAWETSYHATAMLRVTDGEYLKHYTCGPMTYLRVRIRNNCSETFGYLPNSKIGSIRNDRLLLANFYYLAPLICLDHSNLPAILDFSDPTVGKIKDALGKEIAGNETVVRRQYFALGVDVAEQMVWDEGNTAVDCLGTYGDAAGDARAPVMLVTCVYTIGPNRLILNRKQQRECNLDEMVTNRRTPGTKRKLRNICSQLGANYIRVEQHAHLAKIDEFWTMNQVLAEQKYITSPKSRVWIYGVNDRDKFKVAIVQDNENNMYVRCVREDGKRVEVWPLGQEIPNIFIMDMVVTEALISRSYVPNYDGKGHEDMIRNSYLKIGQGHSPYSIDWSGTSFSRISHFDTTVVLVCSLFGGPSKEQPFSIYRFWKTTKPQMTTEQVKEFIKTHCSIAGYFRYMFEHILKDVISRPETYRSSSGFEDRDRILEYGPPTTEHGDGGGDVVVSFKRPGSAPGFRISNQIGCSIDVESRTTDPPIDPSAWPMMVNRLKDDVCLSATGVGDPLLFLTDIPTFYCDNTNTQVIRCVVYKDRVKLVIKHTSPIGLGRGFSNSVVCESTSSRLTQYDQTKVDHCLSLGSQLVATIPSAPHVSP